MQALNNQVGITPPLGDMIFYLLFSGVRCYFTVILGRALFFYCHSRASNSESRESHATRTGAKLIEILAFARMTFLSDRDTRTGRALLDNLVAYYLSLRAPRSPKNAPSATELGMSLLK